jgi:hypothetical protein
VSTQQQKQPKNKQMQSRSQLITLTTLPGGKAQATNNDTIQTKR